MDLNTVDVFRSILAVSLMDSPILTALISGNLFKLTHKFGFFFYTTLVAFDTFLFFFLFIMIQQKNPNLSLLENAKIPSYYFEEWSIRENNQTYILPL